MQIISALMNADVPSRVLVESLPIHPTVAEFLATILGTLEPIG